MRVVLFGVDGLTFSILHPLIERGLLPNFKRICEDGVQGVLKSTIPPMTPPAWMSIATGISPAKHGIYDFWEYEQTVNGPRAHVLTHRRGGKAIWNILSDWGKRVVVANVPITYPPEPVNGIMLSGYMAPDMRAAVTHPASFKEELLQAVPDYQIDLNPAVSSGQVGDPLQATVEMTRKRIDMFRLVLDKPWDFCFIAFAGADRIQHLRWNAIMSFQPQAVKYYEMLDEALGMALNALGSEDLLLVVSDHGFQGANQRFYMQEYLYRRGLLHLQNQRLRRHAEALGFVRAVIRTVGLQRLINRYRKLLRSEVKVVEQAREHHPAELPPLDWNKTKAWLPSASGSLAGYADIFLGDAMTEGQLEELIADIRQLRDPETGQVLAVKICREDIYGNGPFAPPERHLIVLCSESTTILTEMGRKDLWETVKDPTGIHHPDGVLLLYGAGVKKGVTIAASHVYDVCPTILSAMSVPLSEELDGSVIQDAFDRSAKEDCGQNDGIVMHKLKKLAVRAL